MPLRGLRSAGPSGFPVAGFFRVTSHESRVTEFMSRYFIDLTQPEIAAQLKTNPLVILPAGSVEQHGPHLPAGTDIYAANVIGHAVADAIAKEAGELFRLLDEAQGGTAEIKHLKVAG